MSQTDKIRWDQLVDRQSGLLTAEQNRILKETRLLLLGIGGMGMNAAALLARAGFEKFTLMDCDEVDGTNANRTPFAFDDTVGMQKVEATATYLKKINPAIQVRTYPGMKLDFHSDAALTERLFREHDVLSWAMDGMAGRIFYTRIGKQVGSDLPGGKPAVESWALPYHFVVWSFSNTADSETWEETLDLPTAGRPLHEIDAELIKKTQWLFFQRLAGAPQLWKGVDPEVKDKWLALKISNRSIGALVAGCGAMITQQIILQALKLGGRPLDNATIFHAPWMALYDTRRNVAYDFNPRTGQVRYRHPLTNEEIVENGG